MAVRAGQDDHPGEAAHRAKRELLAGVLQRGQLRAAVRADRPGGGLDKRKPLAYGCPLSVLLPYLRLSCLLDPLVDIVSSGPSRGQR